MIFEVLSKICIFIIFLVSPLSKGNLAKQNYDVFKECYDKKIYPELNPYLISTEINGEESLFIPTEYNVYVLARDLYKKGGKLMQGSIINFLDTISSNLFGNGLNKTIYLIKDECHQATNNLDTLSDKFFTKIINVSATPNLKRGQNPDVEISDDEAVNVKLIKRVEFGSDEDTVEDAICWAEILKDISDNSFGKTEVGEPNPHYRQIRTDGTVEPERLSDESKHLWGKNFLVNSEICYEYYLNGLHSSYPDFIMKDKKGRLHIFEVKSVNDSNAIRVNPEEYKDKIRAL